MRNIGRTSRATQLCRDIGFTFVELCDQGWQLEGNFPPPKLKRLERCEVPATAGDMRRAHRCAGVLLDMRTSEDLEHMRLAYVRRATRHLCAGTHRAGKCVRKHPNGRICTQDWRNPMCSVMMCHTCDLAFPLETSRWDMVDERWYPVWRSVEAGRILASRKYF